jgi:RHS repeat-associated protein
MQGSSGKERDAETGLDYFGARYMSAAQGRFTSPDRPFADQNPLDPQSWNLYSYARNNPLKFVDPTGEAIQLTGTTEEDREKELAAIRAGSGLREGFGRSASQLQPTFLLVVIRCQSGFCCAVRLCSGW